MIPVLPPLEEKPAMLEELEGMAPEEAQNAARHEALCRSKTAKVLRALFTRDKNVACLSEVQTLLKKEGLPAGTNVALRWLDVLSWTRGSDGTPFLPLRAHMFGRDLGLRGPKLPAQTERFAGRLALRRGMDGSARALHMRKPCL